MSYIIFLHEPSLYCFLPLTQHDSWITVHCSLNTLSSAHTLSFAHVYAQRPLSFSLAVILLYTLSFAHVYTQRPVPSLLSPSALLSFYFPFNVTLDSLLIKHIVLCSRDTHNALLNYCTLLTKHTVLCSRDTLSVLLIHCSLTHCPLLRFNTAH
jgi:hypothetical protein